MDGHMDFRLNDGINSAHFAEKINTRPSQVAEIRRIY